MNRVDLLAAAACFLLGGGFCAQASTISYTFTQGGFVDSAGDLGTLSGTFTGTPEAGGILQLADLSTFDATFAETVNGVPNNFVFNVPNDFFYDPNTTGSLSFSSGSTQIGIVACTGSPDVNAVCEGLTSPSSPRINASGFFEDLPVFGASLSQQAAVVTVSGGPTSSAPEPGTSVLLASGAILMFAGTFRRRARAERV